MKKPIQINVRLFSVFVLALGLAASLATMNPSEGAAQGSLARVQITHVSGGKSHWLCDPYVSGGKSHWSCLETSSPLSLDYKCDELSSWDLGCLDSSGSDWLWECTELAPNKIDCIETPAP